VCGARLTTMEIRQAGGKLGWAHLKRNKKGRGTAAAVSWVGARPPGTQRASWRRPARPSRHDASTASGSPSTFPVPRAWWVACSSGKIPGTWALPWRGRCWGTSARGSSGIHSCAAANRSVRADPRADLRSLLLLPLAAPRAALMRPEVCDQDNTLSGKRQARERVRRMSARAERCRSRS
jgi:hypothetical protein